MSTITITGNTLAGSFGVGSFAGIGNAFAKSRQTTSNLVNQLNSLKSKVDVACTVANVDTSRQQVSNAKNREETKKSSLTLIYNKLDKLILNTAKVDIRVSEKVQERKDDFYKKYSYLKPDCEKNIWQRGWNKLKGYGKKIWGGLCDFGKKLAKIAIDIGNWCKENWKSLVAVLATIAAAVLIVVACVVTFGGAAVLLAVTVSVAASLIGEFIDDVVNYARTGEWDFSWEEYAGAALGGVVDGALSLIPGAGGAIASSGASSFMETFFTENLKNLSGKQDKSVSRIFGESMADGAMSAAASGLGEIGKSKAFNNLKPVKAIKNSKVVKSLKNFDNKISSKIPVVNRFSGENSYKNSYKGKLTELKGLHKNKEKGSFSIDSIRDGLVPKIKNKVVGEVKDPVIDKFTKRDEWKKGIKNSTGDFFNNLFTPGDPLNVGLNTAISGFVIPRSTPMNMIGVW